MSILVYIESFDGKFKKISYELASYAYKLSTIMNTEVIALLIGEVDEEEMKKLGRYGIRQVLSVRNEALAVFDSMLYARVVSEIALQQASRVVVMANNNTGKAVAPRVSVRLQAGIASGVAQLPESIQPFIIKKRAYSGNAFARLELTSERKIITLSQNSFEPVEQAADITITEVEVDIDKAALKTRVLEVIKQTGKMVLTDAEIVVSGGRGMKSPDNWAPLLELAELLGGATACSRPVSDEGWRPHDEHTGQTGKIIAPNLYFAIGISGATQHLAGISSSKYIVAINNDKDAPIFEAAQYGIVGDAARILPKLVDAVKAMKSN